MSTQPVAPAAEGLGLGADGDHRVPSAVVRPARAATSAPGCRPSARSGSWSRPRRARPSSPSCRPRALRPRCSSRCPPACWPTPLDRRRLLIVGFGGQRADRRCADRDRGAATTSRRGRILGFTFLLGITSTLTSPAWQAIQPELVPAGDDRRVLGARRRDGQRGPRGRPGPGRASCSAWPGSPVVFGLNALSFVGAVVALLWWRRPPQTGLDDRELFAAGAAGRRALRRLGPAGAPDPAPLGPVRPAGERAVGAAARSPPRGSAQLERVRAPARRARRGRGARRLRAPRRPEAVLRQRRRRGQRRAVRRRDGRRGRAAAARGARAAGGRGHRLDRHPHRPERGPAAHAAAVGAVARRLDLHPRLHGHDGGRVVRLGPRGGEARHLGRAALRRRAAGAGRRERPCAPAAARHRHRRPQHRRRRGPPRTSSSSPTPTTDRCSSRSRTRWTPPRSPRSARRCDRSRVRGGAQVRPDGACTAAARTRTCCSSRSWSRRGASTAASRPNGSPAATARCAPPSSVSAPATPPSGTTSPRRTPCADERREEGSVSPAPTDT